MGDLFAVKYNLLEEPLVSFMGVINLQVLCRTECFNQSKWQESTR